MNSRIESGIDLLARLISRPSLSALSNEVLVEGIRTTDAIEICGDKSTGKTLFLYELIGKCILPKCQNGLEVGGCDASVIFLNTDHQFCASKFVKVTKNLVVNECIRNMGNISEATNVIIGNIVHDSLEKLIVINCYEYEQFLITIHTLTDRLLTNAKIALLAIDSITAHYWQSRQIYGPSSIDQYTKKCLKLLRTSTSRCKIATIYIRFRDAPLNSELSRFTTKSLEMPTHIILLERLDKSVLTCSLQSQEGLQRKCTYQIKESGIDWDVQSEQIKEKDQ